MSDQATQYARDVVAGRVAAGPWVRMACDRHLKDIETGPARGLTWRPDLAARAIGFIQCLTLAEGEHSGQPFMLTGFQCFILGALFGWIGADGYRRFRTAYVEIGKGNGKTPLAAAIGLYCLVADGEQGAEVYSAAVSRDQAGICFRDATRFVHSTPALSRRIVDHAHNLAYPAGGSFFRPVSSEGRGLDGKRVFVALVDELHEHPSSVVVDKMAAGVKGRRQPLIFEITNSGYDRNSVCYQHHEYSTKILQGILPNDSWFAYVCALDQGDDPLDDESCWLKANPNLGVSITLKYLREQAEEARNIPSRRNTVLRLNFCVWTEKATAWMPMEHWDACGERIPETAWDEHGRLVEATLAGRECLAGLDLSQKYDLTACVFVFPPSADDPRWLILPRFWIPEEAMLERVKRDHVPYDLWRDQGFIQTTPGNVVDYDFIRAQINADGKQFVVREIAYDPWNAMQVALQLQGDGFTAVPFRQGYASMSEPMKELEKLSRAHKLAHGGNPVLRWMASNIAAAQDPAGNLKPDKSRSIDRIDGIVALIMALGRATLGQQPTQPALVVL